MSSSSSRKPSVSIRKRRSARLAAVQYIYQWKQEEKPTPVEQYITNYRTRLVEDADVIMEDHAITPDTPPDYSFLRKMLNGLNDEYEAVRGYLALEMEKGRTHERTSPMIQALLEAGTYELIHRGDLDANIILSEYTALAAGFFDNPELAFVNGILQEVSNSLGDDEPKADTVVVENPED